MAFNPLTEKGIPLERQLRNWSELAVEPYRTEDVHPYAQSGDNPQLRSLAAASDPVVLRHLAAMERLKAGDGG